MTRPAAIALPLLLVASLVALPAPAAATPVDCGFQCSLEECTSPQVVGPQGQIDCATSGAVFCDHPFTTIDHCDIWQVCYAYGTGLVGCANQGDGHGQSSCVSASTCMTVHTFRVGPGEGPFFNLCSTFGAGSTSPTVALPAVTVATKVKLTCSVAATFNT